MTHTSNTAASSATSCSSSSVSSRAPTETRADRARSEEMTIRPLRDRRYVVETNGGTYVVALAAGTCTCPDHAIRGARCKHLRRVAMAVTNGEVPAPDERVGVCAVCGSETFVPFEASGPQLCSTHEPETGDVVRDRETGQHLLVTAVTATRVDEYDTGEGRTVDEYATNADYGAHEPVVEAIYVDSLSPTRDLSDAKRYGFPASRLRAVDPGATDGPQAGSRQVDSQQGDSQQGDNQQADSHQTNSQQGDSQ